MPGWRVPPITTVVTGEGLPPASRLPAQRSGSDRCAGVAWLPL